MFSRHEKASSLYGLGAVLAVVMVVGWLLPVLGVELFGYQLTRQLMWAVDRGDRVATRLWLLTVDQNLMSSPPLVQATRNGDRKMVHLLLEAGADVNYRGKDGPTPLEAAARRGKLELMRDFLAAGARVEPGYTLSEACRETCQPEAVKLLLDAGALPREGEERRLVLAAARSRAERAECDAVLRLLPAESPVPFP